MTGSEFRANRRVQFAETFKRMGRVEFWNDWKPWVAFLLIGLFFLAGWIGELQAKTLQKDTVRLAAVQNCLTSIGITRKFSLHVQGVDEGFAALVNNYENTLRHTPTWDPQFQVRLTNLRRLRSAAQKVSALPEIPVPTESECQQKGK